MKILSRFIPVLIMVWFTFSGCDKIEPPYMTNTDQDGGNGETVRKFLLEEFTGHRCPNCPAGTEVAKTLKTFYGDRLVIVTIHAGFFAMPMSDPFQYDFRTPEGTALNDYFGITQNPVGLVNRNEFEGALLLTPGAWGSAMQVLEDFQPDVRLDIGLTRMSGNENFRLDAGITSLKDQEVELYLVALLVEDGIIKPQKTNDPDYPDGVILDYEHNHILRMGITDIWGEKISEGLFGFDDAQHRNYDFQIDSGWVKENCSVVVYVMNSDMEILQVEQKKLPSN
ncbi:MAG: Omp28-related outer membrane protein [Bacteroidales bacterium]